MESKTKIKWLVTPEEQDYPAAESYLGLIYDSKTVAKLSRKLKKAPVSEFQAKDSKNLNYDGAPIDGSAWHVDGVGHVIRGGSWHDLPVYMRGSTR